MKVIAVLGSPRKNGVSSRIVESFMEVVQDRGCETKTYALNEMNFQGCKGCHACKGKSEICVLNDELTEVLSDMKTADITLLATPVHFGDVSGQFKCFFDRTWSLVKPDFLTNPDPCRLIPGKKVVLIVSQGDISEKHQEVVKKYKNFLDLYGYIVNVIRATDCGIRVDADINEQIVQAREMAVRMIG